MNGQHYDVAIVGGGLAGCSAAINLAEHGYRVGLFEAKAYPHDKVCGEFLSPECGDLLDELGVMPAVHALNPTRINTTRITTPNGLVWEEQMPAPAIGLSRYALDQLLADRARARGVSIHDRATVIGIRGSLDTGFSLSARTTDGQMQTQAQVVIGAHGKRSNLDRALSRSFLRAPQPFVGLKAHFYGASLTGRVELHTFEGGYCGLAEVEGGRVNACLLVRQATFQRVSQQNIPAFVAWMAAQNPYLDDWLSQARQIQSQWLSIAQVPFVSKRLIEQDVLMAGDAAGLIAPLAGDGMGMALAGGKLIAAWVDRYLSGQLSVTDLRAGYPSAWRRKFAGRLRLGRLLQTVMLRPRWLTFGLHIIKALPALGHFFIAHTRDPQLTSILKL